MKFLMYLFLILSCNNQSPQKEMNSTILIKIFCNAEGYDIDSPIPINVIIKNSSKKAVLVNTRLAVGYKNSISRELFAIIEDKKSGKLAEYFEVDIDRDFSIASDYKWFKPNEEIKTVFDLKQYYPLSKAGTYSLILYYESNETHAKYPQDILKGVYESNVLFFNIKK